MRCYRVGALGELHKKAPRLRLTLLCGLMCFGACLWPLQGLEAAEPSVRRALLVGVQEFEDDTQLEKLPYAVKDIVELYQVLANPALGGFTDLRVVASRKALEQVARTWPALRETVDHIVAGNCQDIRSQMKTSLPCLYEPTYAGFDRALGAVVNVTESQDLLLVQLSTHGMLRAPSSSDVRVDPQNVLYLFQDSQLDARAGAGAEDRVRLERVFSQKEVLDRLEQTRAQQVLLWEGTCRNPFIAKSAKTELLPPPSPPRRTVVLSDAAPGQRAYEHEVIEGGVHMHFMLEAMWGYADPSLRLELDQNQDGALSLQELYQYAVPRVSAATQEQQIPSLTESLRGNPAELLLVGIRQQAPQDSRLYLDWKDGPGRYGVGASRVKSRSVQLGKTAFQVNEAYPQVVFDLEPGLHPLRYRETTQNLVTQQHQVLIHIPAHKSISTPRLLRRLNERKLLSFSAGPMWSGLEVSPAERWNGSVMRLSMTQQLVLGLGAETDLGVWADLKLALDAGLPTLEYETLTGRWATQTRGVGGGVGVSAQRVWQRGRMAWLRLGLTHWSWSTPKLEEKGHFLELSRTHTQGQGLEGAVGVALPALGQLFPLSYRARRAQTYFEPRWWSLELSAGQSPALQDTLNLQLHLGWRQRF